MIPLQKLLDFTGENEGLRLTVYKCPAGKDTIGYGHNITDNGIPKEVWPEINGWSATDRVDNLQITEPIARKLFEIDIRKAENELLGIFPEFDMFSENRKIALIDMMFNLGLGSFRGFTRMISAINLGMWKLAVQEVKNSLYYRQVTNRAKRVIEKLQ